MVHQGLSGRLDNGGQVVVAERAGERVVIEARQGDHGQNVTAVNVHHYRRRVVARRGVLLQRFLHHLLEVKVDGEDEVSSVQGPPLRDDLQLAPERVHFYQLLPGPAAKKGFVGELHAGFAGVVLKQVALVS